MLLINIYSHEQMCLTGYSFIKSNFLEKSIRISRDHFKKEDLKLAMQEIDFIRMRWGDRGTAEFIKDGKMVMHLDPVSYWDEETGKYKRTNWYLGKTYNSDHAVVRKWGC